MNRLSTIVVLTALSSLLTPVVVSATGINPERPAVSQQDKAETTRTSARADEPGCRRVKVVYAGYGEGQRTGCTVTAEVER